MDNFSESGAQPSAEATPTMVTESRYFSSEFNTAIIDGPLRIYFADRQEGDALQIYFHIQETLATRGMKLDSVPMSAPNMFLMLYPSPTEFKDAFELEDEVAFGKFGKHLVLGISGPCEASTRMLIGNQVRSVFAEAMQADALIETHL